MSKAAEDTTEVARVEDKSSNDNETMRKRTGGLNPKKRVSQACGRCRTRKDKCDGKRPACSTCAAADEVCTYDPATKKRGLPEGYVRGIEKFWGISLRKSEGLEESVMHILTEETSVANLDSFAKLWNDKEDGETLLETWRKSNVFQELERLLPILDLSDDKPGKRKRADNAPSRRLENTTNPPLSASVSSRIEPEQRASPARIPVQKDDFLNAPPSRIGSSIIPPGVPAHTAPSLPGRAWHLIDIFFSYTHCWFPIIEKPDLLKISYQYSANNSALSSHQSGNHAVLWAILAYADHQSGAIAPSTESNDPGRFGDWTADKFYRESKMLIPAEEGLFELGHVQALLILTLLNMGLGHWSRAWLLVGQAARVAINLGLDKGRGIESKNVRVFLCCFTLDTLVALHLDRKPQLRVSDLKSVGAIEEDGSDEWNPWVDSLSLERRPAEYRPGPAAIVSTFNRLIPLIKILNSISHDDSTGTARVDKCQELMDELGSCGQILPTQFTPTPNSRSEKGPPFLPHQYHLHLAHLGALAAVRTHLDTSDTSSRISDATTIETFVTSAHQAMCLLIRYSESFGLSIVPPTFDCFITIALRSFRKVPRRVLDEQRVTYTEWQENMLRSLSAMATVWPTFDVLKTSLTKPSLSSDSPHQSTLPPLTAINQFNTNEQALSQLTPQSMAPDKPASGYNPSVAIRESGQHPIRTDSDTRPQNGTTHSISSDLVSNAGSSTSLQGSTMTWNQFAEQSLADSRNGFNTAGTFGSHVDGDSTFNEFAAIDAMEW